jgi:O-antigen/teichoic acid export membrane protein
MQKKFLKNLGLLLFLNLLVKPFWILGVDRQVQNVVGPESYGLYFAIFNFSFLFYIFLDVGITNFNNRNIAQNNQLLSKHLAGISLLKLFLGIFYGILIFIIGIIWGYRGEQLYLLGWVGFNQFLLSFILYIRSNLSGLLLFKTDSFLSVLDRILMILICGFLLWFNFLDITFTIHWFVYSQTLAYVLTLIIALIAVFRKTENLKISWNMPFFIMIMKKSLPFALLVLIMSFYNRIDPVLLEKILPGKLGEQQSGVYAQAFRLLDAGQNFSYLFAVLLLPLFSKMIKHNESVEKLIKLSFSIIISGSLLIAITAQFFSNDIMKLMYYQFHNETLSEYLLRIDQSSQIFKLLMFSFVGISSNYIFGTLLTANNNLKQLNLVAFAGLLINVILNLLLIPVYMSVGSAWASLTTQLSTAIIQVILVQYYFKFKINYELIISLLAFVILLISTGYLVVNSVSFRWEISLFIMLITGMIYAVLLKLLHVKEFIKIIKGE